MKESVYIEYVPEHYTHEVSITIRVKRSVYEKNKRWFDAFAKMREIDLDVINRIIPIARKKKGNHEKRILRERG